MCVFSAHMVVRIDESAFRQYPIAGETVIVTGSQSAEISRGMEAAGERFMRINELGREYTEEEYAADDGELLTPSWVSDVEEVRDGYKLYVDCKGEVQPAMRTTFIRVLRDELARSGVTDAEVFSLPYADLDD